MSHALNMITGFSVIPLRVASVIGFVFMLLGMAILVYVIYVKVVHGIAVQGYASLASMIAIFSGAQLFSLGIIGEYLARMHFRMMDRPAYAVRDSTQGWAASEERKL
jgi:undecaprenyl-phosphate 4-deoxy-4-formamido-L-arabinose transferase